jgi:tripartite-type tricarboxylate transporter receptor subunit TctC
MRPRSRVWLVCAVCLTGSFTWVAPAQAQYPTRSIRFILPFPPGGGTDTMGRAIGTRLGEALGQQIIIDIAEGKIEVSYDEQGRPIVPGVEYPT